MPMIREASRSGWKTSSASYFSPIPTNFTGWPVTCLIESAAPPRASPSIFVRMNPLKPSLFVELLGALNRVLSEHCVGDEQDFVRSDLVFDLGEFLHQLFIDVQASCSIDQKNVVAGVSRFPQGALAQSERLIACGSFPDLDARCLWR